MNGRRILLTAVSIIFVLTIALPSALAKPLSLVTHTKNPASARGKQVQFFADEVFKRTGGKIQIKIFWGDALVTAKEALEGTAKGICDMADLVTVYYPDKLPLYQIAPVVPFIKSDPIEGVEIARKLVDKFPVYYQDLEKKYNQVPIYIVGKDSYQIISNKPIKGLGDLKGMKIGGFGRWIPKWLSAAGATPVTIAAGELYTAFQRGTIDGRVFGVATVKQFGLQEVVKYTSMVDFGSWPLLALLTVNKSVWGKVSPETQEIFRKVGLEAEQMGPKMIKDEEEKLITLFKKAGMEFLEFPEADRKKWRNLQEIRALPDLWIKEVKAKGYANAEEIMNTWLELQDWR